MVRYNGRMIETPLPLALELGAPVPAPDRASILEQLATLRLENAALRAQHAVLEARSRELGARLGQDSSNSSGGGDRGGRAGALPALSASLLGATRGT
jgi:hypothetical protein